jgi:cytochrome P450
MDIFISLCIHRDERFWPNPGTNLIPATIYQTLQASRCSRMGRLIKEMGRKLYPSESSADLPTPFGGGARKVCVGDDFCHSEAAVTLAMVLRRFDFDFDKDKLEARMT